MHTSNRVIQENIPVQIKKELDVLRSNSLIFKWEHTGSNRGPSACKADALNQLSYAPVLLGVQK